MSVIPKELWIKIINDELDRSMKVANLTDASEKAIMLLGVQTGILIMAGFFEVVEEPAAVAVLKDMHSAIKYWSQRELEQITKEMGGFSE